MAGPDEDWFSYIIGGIVTALLSVVGTVVALAKKIEGKYVDDIKALQESQQQLQGHVAECEERHHQAEIRLARLEGKYEQGKQ